MTIDRRHLVKLLSSGGSLLTMRALASGLPISWILDPQRALAQNPIASMTVAGKAQYLILNSSDGGDPFNANMPGSYGAKSTHPSVAAAAGTSIPAQGATGAQAWSALPANVLARAAFFHYATYTSNHPDMAKVFALQGSMLTGTDMLPSFLAAATAPTLGPTGAGTIQVAPIVIGGQGDYTFTGAPIAPVSPLGIRSLFSGPASPLGNLQKLRDTTVDAISAALKSQAATTQQRQLLDAYVQSRAQAREIGTNAITLLQSIKDNDEAGQVATAVALILMNLTPVIGINLDFGGDNHTDAGLAREGDTLSSAVGNIRTLLSTLATYNLQDKVTFANMGVFGRTLTSKDGRDHNDSHCGSVIIGKNVKAGVVGGVNPSDNDSAAPVNSATGQASPGGGDVPFDQLLASFGKTLATAVGLDPTSVNTSITKGKTFTSVIA